MLRVLTGLGADTLPPNAVGAISDVISPERRAQAVGGLLAISLLSTALSVPLAALLADWVGWRFTFAVAGLLVGTGLLANWIWFPRDIGESVRDLVIFSRNWPLLSMQFFRVALTINITHRIAYWAVVSFFAAYLIQTYGVDVRFVALPLAVAAIGQVSGSYGGGLLASKASRGFIIGAITVAGGVRGFLLFTVDLNLWTAVAVATFASGFLSIPFPLLVAPSTEYSGESKATGVGMMGFSNQSGGKLGGAIAGALPG